ncbi:M48 family metallopeptidase [candidate division KSB1 bacterium]
MKSLIEEVDGVGQVLFVKSKKAKRLNISIRPKKPVRVAVPILVSFKKAKMFAELKRPWIVKNLKKQKQLENIHAEITKTNSIDGKEAENFLRDSTERIARKYGFIYNKLTLRNQRTRWGSCSSRNNISLNRKLIYLPQKLIEYVILHEMVHTRIKNHSKKFWTELKKYCSNCLILRKELKFFDPGLF